MRFPSLELTYTFASLSNTSVSQILTYYELSSALAEHITDKAHLCLRPLL